VEAVGARKQLLAPSASAARPTREGAQRILEGIGRRAAQLASADEVNAYFAADAIGRKLRDIGRELGQLGDAVKADELDARSRPLVRMRCAASATAPICSRAPAS